MSREDLVNLEFVPKLFFFECVVYGNLDHDAGMNLIDEGDASLPDPVHVWKQLLGGHRQGKTR